MAKLTETNEKTTETNSRPEIELPRGSREDKYIAVNGVAYIVPRKGKHAVPPEIAEEYYRSQRAEDAREENQSDMLSRAAKA